MMKSKIKILIGLLVVLNFVAITIGVCDNTNMPLPSGPGDPGNGSTPGLTGAKWQQEDNPTIINDPNPQSDSVNSNAFHFIENCLTPVLT